MRPQLQWSPPAYTDRAQISHGSQGRYRIAPEGARYRLTGVGPDGLAMLSLPPDGQLYDTARLAMSAAQRVDRAPAGEMSGA